MSRARPSLSQILVLLLCLALAPGQLFAQQPRTANEAAKLHALIMADTLDKNIGKDVKTDLGNMKRFLEAGFAKHKDRLDLTVLEGKECTPEKILTYYKNAKIDSNDAVLFYFAGHGSLERGTGHQLITGP